MHKVNSLWVKPHEEADEFYLLDEQSRDNEGQTKKYSVKCGKCPVTDELGKSWGYRFLYYIFMTIIGIGGSAGVTLLYSWLGQFKVNDDPETVITFVCLGVVGGVIGNRILPKIGDKVEEDLLRKAKEEATKAGKAKQEAKMYASKAIESKQVSMDYADAITSADTALGRDSAIDIPFAIDRLKSILPDNRLNRTVNIYLGRLYRKGSEFTDSDEASIGKLKAAIRCLRAYIQNIRESEDSGRYNTDLADAFYNIACYHALLIKYYSTDTDNERLLKEALVALMESRDLCEDSILDAKTDPDFDSINKDPRFSEILEGATSVSQNSSIDG